MASAFSGVLLKVWEDNICGRKWVPIYIQLYSYLAKASSIIEWLFNPNWDYVISYSHINIYYYFIIKNKKFAVNSNKVRICMRGDSWILDANKARDLVRGSQSNYICEARRTQNSANRESKSHIALQKTALWTFQKVNPTFC